MVKGDLSIRSYKEERLDGGWMDELGELLSNHKSWLRLQVVRRLCACYGHLSNTVGSLIRVWGLSSHLFITELIPKPYRVGKSEKEPTIHLIVRTRWDLRSEYCIFVSLLDSTLFLYLIRQLWIFGGYPRFLFWNLFYVAVVFLLSVN